jgi:5-hydroxyisourate hydrolase-like protein (transthyretin family)
LGRCRKSGNRSVGSSRRIIGSNLDRIAQRQKIDISVRKNAVVKAYSGIFFVIARRFFESFSQAKRLKLCITIEIFQINPFSSALSPLLTYKTLIMRLLISLTFLFFSSLLLTQAQPPRSAFSISGKIIDQQSGNPVEYANVVLLTDKDSVLVTGTITNADGTFILSNLKPGTYRIQFSFIGYVKTEKRNLVLSSKQPSIKLGDLSLPLDSKNLDEVVVNGERSMMTNKIDRRVITVDKSFAGQSGSATDVLQTVPSVAVDLDGNVSLRGSDNVTILINGRPSTLTGSSQAAILQQLPANSIESIEVITNPSARFDADGTAGIINIILKKDARRGFNGDANISVGNNNQYNGGLSLSYNPGRFTFNGSYAYRDYNHEHLGSINRVITDSMFIRNTNDQTSSDESKGKSHLFRGGIDYKLSQTASVGINGSFNLRKKEGTEIVKYTQSYNNEALKKYNRKTDEGQDGNNADVNAYLQKSFAEKGHEMKSEFTYSNGYEDNNNNYLESNKYVDATDLQLDSYILKENQIQKNTQNFYTFTTDYVRPFGENAKLETGFKSIIKNTENDLQTYTIDTLQNAKLDINNTNDFVYNEQIHALYGTYSQTIGKYSFMLGVRLEESVREAELKGEKGINFDTSYFNVFPSVHLAQKINDNNEIMFSYSERINRPNMRMINPFEDRSDPLNPRKGNPAIDPEYIHSFELGYNYNKNKLTFTPTIYHKIIMGKFSSVSVPQGNNVILNTFTNLHRSTESGLEMVTMFSPFKFWNMNLSTNFFYSTLDSSKNDKNDTKDNFNWQGRLISNFVLTPSTSMQISGFYRSPFVSTQGKSLPMASMDLGIRQIVLKRKGTITLSVRDVFSSMRFGMNIDQPEYHQKTKRWRKDPDIFLGFSYRFGESQKSNNKKQQKTDNMDNSNDMNDML